MIKLKLFFLLMVCFFLTEKSLVAQEIQATKNGEFIVVMPDGSWATYDAKIGAHKSLMKSYKQKKKEAEKTAAKEAKNSTGNQKKIISDYLKNLETEKLKGQLADKAMANRKEKETQLTGLKKIAFNKSNQDIKNLTKLLSEAKDEEKKAVSEFKDANKEAKKARAALTKLNVEHSLYPPYQLMTNKNKEEDDLPVLVVDSNGNASVEDHTIPAGAATTAPKLVEAVPEIKEEKTSEKPKKEKEKKEKKAKEEKATVVKEDKKAKKSEAKSSVVVVKADAEIPFKKPKELLPENDVMETPPPSACKIAFDGVDEFSGKRRREVAKTPLFQFTDETMKKYYEGEDFLTCEAAFSMSEATGYKFLTFTFTFASDNVGTSYGWLEKDNLLSIRLIGGETLNLYNSRTDRGIVDNVNRKTTYNAICLIGAGEEKILSKSEVDAIRVMWSTGTEDYEIYDVDVFADQLKCLNSKK
jgi:hypothetical protein